MKTLSLLSSILILLFSGCNTRSSDAPTVSEEIWGETDGKEVRLFTLANKNGMVIKITNYGGTLTYVSFPDKNGQNEPVVLGFDSLDNYLGRHPNFGSTVGRFANRIRWCGVFP